MVLRRGICNEFLPRLLMVRVLAGFLVLLAWTMPASATLLPEGFFDQQVQPGQGPAAVEADRLSYDARQDIISAEGDVVLSYQGYVIRADRLEYHKKTGELSAIGHVTVHDPRGDVFAMDRVEITAAMKQAFIDSLTVTTAEGAIITARDVNYSNALQVVLTDAAYSPCGLCIDSKGRKIGWKVKTARLIYDRDSASVILEQPSLELLGIPVAWLPWFWIPDPTQPRATGLRMPEIGYDPELGATLTVPYFVPVGRDVDLILKPELMSRQGVLLRADLKWRWPQLGTIDIKASGIYQLDKSAFAGTVGDRDWRGAIQTSGHFTPAAHWTAGWSYTAFSDNAYLTDYNLTDANSWTNQVYTTYLDSQTWVDARIQRFAKLGNYGPANDAQQGLAVPDVEFDHVHDLADGWGRLHVTGEVLGVHREADQTRSYNGVPYVLGFEGNKVHGEVEGAWENQVILPGGVAATPYLGLRLDGAWYDGGSTNASAPPESVLFSATPIAAIDVRWPLVASSVGGTHLFEPIAQLVYRGSSTTSTGITNDDAQSFVFDTANLFDYNHFSGIDRQETGLRANIGGHYVGTFDDGSWLDFVAGQSFHLLGDNTYGTTDAAQVGASTSGLDTAASFVVASVRGGMANGFSAGAKVEIDPAAARVAEAGIGVRYDPPGSFSVGTDYVFIAADPSVGTIRDAHEISPYAAVPVADYWTLDGGLTYDIVAMTWLNAYSGITYDDGYLKAGVRGTVDTDSWGVGVTFGLKGPDGELAF